MFQSKTEQSEQDLRTLVTLISILWSLIMSVSCETQLSSTKPQLLRHSVGTSKKATEPQLMQTRLDSGPKIPAARASWDLGERSSVRAATSVKGGRNAKSMRSGYRLDLCMPSR